MKPSLLFPFAVSLFLLALPCAGATTYQVDAGASSVAWDGAKVVNSHNGHVGVKSGSVTVDESGQLTGAEITIDMTAMTNDDIKRPGGGERLVGHLKSDDFFSVSTHPTATFSLTEAAATTATDGTTHMLTGDLTIKGQSHPVSFPATLSVGAGEATASGTLVFDRTKWGIRYGSGSFFSDLGDRMILDDVTLVINIKAATTAAP